MSTTTNLLDAVRNALGALPQPLQAAADGEPVPLAIGVHDELVKRLTAAGKDPEEAAKLVRRLLFAICIGNGYLQALSADLARRVDLDGNDAGAVDPAHALTASNTLLTRAMKAQAKAVPKPNKPAKPKPKAAAEPPPTSKPASGAFAGGTLTLPASRRPGVAVRPR